jgi:hypothetical protein
METNEQKRRRLFGKQFLSEYLKELNDITNIKIIPEKLLSIEKSDIVRAARYTRSKSCILNFNDKEKLLLVIGQLIKIKDGPCYLYTTYSKDCGLLQLDYLGDFKIYFNFTDEHAGFIKIIMQDLSNSISLDFYEERGNQLLEIEIFGEDWCKVEIS